MDGHCGGVQADTRVVGDHISDLGHERSHDRGHERGHHSGHGLGRCRLVILRVDAAKEMEVEGKGREGGREGR